MYNLKNWTPRLYQETIFHTASNANTLVCLPTGKGKTKIALLLALHRLNSYPNSKIVVLTPTKPLALQIGKEFSDCSDIPDIITLTGNIQPEKRRDMFVNAKVIISTPQGMYNDILEQRISLTNVSLLVLDECHHATGDYAYVKIAELYTNQSNTTKILGLTASPGSNLEKIKEICKNLFIENIEVRTEEDEDIQPFMKDTHISYRDIPFPLAFEDVRKALNEMFQRRAATLRDHGFPIHTVNKKQLLIFQQSLIKRIRRCATRDDWALLSLCAEAMKITHILELFETQGVHVTQEYLQKLFIGAEGKYSKAAKNLLRDPIFSFVVEKINRFHLEGIEHPKLEVIKTILTQEMANIEKVLIFANYRESGNVILNTVESCGKHAKLFIGQTKKKGQGLSQVEQASLLEEFKLGEFPVLIATSVGEEGIDIPAVDLIIFYEPVPSAIRTVQRRGRTGRMKEGSVIVLVTKGTRDEAYRWVAHRKEKQMYTTLKKLKEELPKKKQSWSTLR